MLFRKKKEIDSNELREKTQEFVEDLVDKNAHESEDDVNSIMIRMKNEFNKDELEFLATQFVIRSSIDYLQSQQEPKDNDKDKEMMYR